MGRRNVRFTAEEDALIRKLYLQEKLTTAAIAKRLGNRLPSSIGTRLHFLGVKVRPRGYGTRFTPEEDALIVRLYVEEGRSTEFIARKLGQPAGTIHYRLKKCGVKPRPSPRVTPAEEAEIERLYADEKLSHNEIFRRLGRSRQAVLDTLKRRGVEIRQPMLRRFTRDEDERIRRLYLEERRGVSYIAGVLCRAGPAVDYRLTRMGIKRRTRAEANFRPFNPEEDERLRQMYVHQKMSTNQIQKVLLRSRPVLLRRLGDLGVRARSHAQAARLRKYPETRHLSGGYWRVPIPLDSPLASMGRRTSKNARHVWVAEHRLVMARHLGRPLESWEIVHHIDHDKVNNRIENLQLLDNQATHNAETAEHTNLKKLRVENEKLKSQNQKLRARMRSRGKSPDLRKRSRRSRGS